MGLLNKLSLLGENLLHLTYKVMNFIEKSKKIHGDRYDYSLVEYVNNSTKVKIICHTHGVFEQIPAKHTRGSNCPSCVINMRKEKNNNYYSKHFIEISKNIHNNKYDYSLVEYLNNNTKVKIICTIHGVFEQLPSNHSKGANCPSCVSDSRKKRMKKDNDYFLQKAVEIHGLVYDYSKVDYINNRNKVTILCSKHGSFEQEPRYHLTGSKCPKCVNEEKSKSMIKSFDDFEKLANEVHNNKFSYKKTDYISMRVDTNIICPIHGEFKQTPHNHVNGYGCFKCSKNGTSKKEKEVLEFLSNYVECDNTNREVLNNKELDVYIPSKRVAIEFNGLYWHNSKFKDSNYHLDKLNDCEEKGIKLIQIFEDEWDNKQEITKSRLLNILNLTKRKIFARKTEIREVNSSLSMKFLRENHIQGELGSSIKLGLFYNNELVSLMTFGSLRKNLGQTKKEGSWELLRFCNKLNTTVVGGASKLFKNFIENYSPKEVITYADRRWSNGEMYKHLGFNFEENTKPSYFYVANKKRENRFKYRKSELIKQGFNKNISEKEIMEGRNILRIYDCGTKRFKFINKNLVD